MTKINISINNRSNKSSNRGSSKSTKKCTCPNPRCRGTGEDMLSPDGTCQRCGGTGKVPC